MRLANTHALRAYDAVQLAAALEINQKEQDAGFAPVTLISGDQALNDGVRSRQCQGFPRNPGRFHPGSGLSPPWNQLGAIEGEASFLVK